MLVTTTYNRLEAVDYARKWAYLRNPKYYDFSMIGGDCTNFASQCLYAGCNVMNYPAWYYESSDNRSPSWTGVEFLYDFLIKNNGLGPRGIETEIDKIKPGDIVQLKFEPGGFVHSPVVVETGYPVKPSNLLVATHTFDCASRPLDTYSYIEARFIHITGVGKNM
ncbi:MAG: amidase domain-containing protein [Bacillota bacterium]|nr:amidase domain-containing protein [Bacillota bacterium]